jgi:LysM repeat protein
LLGSKLKYKNYQWPYNPSFIEILGQKNLKQLPVPFAGNIVQDFGEGNRLVKGKGEFFGEYAAKEYKQLFEIYKDKTSGFLNIPGIESFKAYFKSLVINCKPGPLTINYSFEFVEDLSIKQNTGEESLSSYHVVVLGETLFDIANKYGFTADYLLRLNPWIKRPDELKPGDKVVIR